MDIKNVNFSVILPVLEREDIILGFPKALESIYQNNVVGKVVCANPVFGMFKMEKFDQYVDKPLYSEKKIKINIIKQDWMNL